MRLEPYVGRTTARPGLLLGCVLIAVLGCGTVPSSMPDTPADIAGAITAIDRAGEAIGSIRVEAVPGDSAGSAKAVVWVEQSTQVRGPGSRESDFNDLAVGQRVRVWYRGPAMESYPVRAAASAVVIDATTP